MKKRTNIQGRIMKKRTIFVKIAKSPSKDPTLELMEGDELHFNPSPNKDSVDLSIKRNGEFVECLDVFRLPSPIVTWSW